MPILADSALLEVRGASIGYGKITVLHDVDITIAAGEVVALLGPNGAGKTTLLRGISGLLPLKSGSMSFLGQDISHTNPRVTTCAGLSHVVEGHRVFTQLSVMENLLLAAYDLPRRERGLRADEALSYFPEIAAKQHQLGGSLSGGQQQMLAVAQGLMRRPKLLMLDEPSAGLSPVLVDRVLDVCRTLRANGTSVLLVEQLIDKALGLADRVYALVHGRIALETSDHGPDVHKRLEQAYMDGSVS